MAKKKVPPRFYFAAFIVFLPQCISFLFTNSLESWVTNWWNTSQSENFLNAIEEKSMIEKFLELEDLILFDEIIKEYSETHQQNLRLGIHTAIIQLSKIHNKERIHTILHFSTNITSFVILIAYSILGKKELVIINSWAQDFLYNLNDTTKALCIIFVVDFFLGYHSIRGWDLIISSVYKDFLGFIPNDQILLCLHSLLPVFLDSIFKYWVFFYLNRVSPSLVGIYHAINK